MEIYIYFHLAIYVIMFYILLADMVTGVSPIELSQVMAFMAVIIMIIVSIVTLGFITITF